MKFDLYVRVAKHHRYRRGHRIEASMVPNQEPLTVGGSAPYSTPVHTAFFKLRIDVPDRMLRPESIPTFEITIDPEDVTTVTPPVEIEVAPMDFDPVPLDAGDPGH